REGEVKRRGSRIHRQVKARGFSYSSSFSSHRDGGGVDGCGRCSGDSQSSGTGRRTRGGRERRAGSCGQPRGGEGHRLRRARDQRGTDGVGDRSASSNRLAAAVRQREVKSARPQIFLDGEVVFHGPAAV